MNSNDDIADSLYLQSTQMMPNMMNMFDKEQNMKCVTGLRPLTYDTSIIVGKVKEYDNLYLSVGPGYNGFKTAMGSALLLSEIVCNNKPNNFFAPHKHGVKKCTSFCSLADL